MVTKYEKMIVSMARYYTGDPTLLKDLVQEGWIGVHHACDQWREDMGASFSTYANIKARDMMQRYVRHKVKVVSEPRRAKQKSTILPIGNIEPAAYDWTEHIDLQESLKELDWQTRELITEHIGKGVEIVVLSAVHGIHRNTCAKMIKQGLEQLRKQMV